MVRVEPRPVTKESSAGYHLSPTIHTCFFRNVKHIAGSFRVACTAVNAMLQDTAAEDNGTATKERVLLCSFSWF